MPKFDTQDPENQRILNKTPATWIQEICVKLGVDPRYRIMDVPESGQSGEPSFLATLIIPKAGLGWPTMLVSQTGRNKKIAKQRAAIAMLNGIGLTKDDLINFSKTKILPTPQDPHAGKTYVALNGLPSVDEDVQSQNDPKEEKVDIKEEGKVKEETAAIAPVPEPDPNSIGNLTSFCLRNGLNRPVFNVEAQPGSPHCPTYTVTCTIDSVGLANPYVRELTDTTGLKKIKRRLANLTLNNIRVNLLEVDILKVAQEHRAKALATETDKRNASRKADGKKDPLKNLEPTPGPSGSSARTGTQGKKSNLMTLAQASSTRSRAKGRWVEDRSEGFCKVENGEKFGGCMCKKCLDACRALTRNIGGSEMILQEFCKDRREEGKNATAEYKLDLKDDKLICNLTLRVGSCVYSFQGKGKTPKLARDAASKVALRLISDGLF